MNHETNLPASIKVTKPTIVEDTRKFFISYKKDSAFDLAKHVYDGLNERGVEVFLDEIDVEKGVTKKEWQKQIDDAVEQAQVILLIMTNGASNSSGVKRELRLARKDENKKIFAFIDNSIWNEEGETTIVIRRKKISVKDYQVSRFDAQRPESLLREVCASARVVRAYKPSI